MGLSTTALFSVFGDYYIHKVSVIIGDMYSFVGFSVIPQRHDPVCIYIATLKSGWRVGVKKLARCLKFTNKIAGRRDLPRPDIPLIFRFCKFKCSIVVTCKCLCLQRNYRTQHISVGECSHF